MFAHMRAAFQDLILSDLNSDTTAARLFHLCGGCRYLQENAFAVMPGLAQLINPRKGRAICYEWSRLMLEEMDSTPSFMKSSHWLSDELIAVFIGANNQINALIRSWSHYHREKDVWYCFRMRNQLTFDRQDETINLKPSDFIIPIFPEPEIDWDDMNRWLFQKSTGSMDRKQLKPDLNWSVPLDKDGKKLLLKEIKDPRNIFNLSLEVKHQLQSLEIKSPVAVSKETVVDSVKRDTPLAPINDSNPYQQIRSPERLLVGRKSESIGLVANPDLMPSRDDFLNTIRRESAEVKLRPPSVDFSFLDIHQTLPRMTRPELKSCYVYGKKPFLGMERSSLTREQPLSKREKPSLLETLSSRLDKNDKTTLKKFWERETLSDDEEETARMGVSCTPATTGISHRRDFLSQLNPKEPPYKEEALKKKCDAMFNEMHDYYSSQPETAHLVDKKTGLILSPPERTIIFQEEFVPRIDYSLMSEYPKATSVPSRPSKGPIVGMYQNSLLGSMLLREEKQTEENNISSELSEVEEPSSSDEEEPTSQKDVVTHTGYIPLLKPLFRDRDGTFVEMKEEPLLHLKKKGCVGSNEFSLQDFSFRLNPVTKKRSLSLAQDDSSSSEDDYLDERGLLYPLTLQGEVATPCKDNEQALVEFGFDSYENRHKFNMATRTQDKKKFTFPFQDKAALMEMEGPLFEEHLRVTSESVSEITERHGLGLTQTDYDLLLEDSITRGEASTEDVLNMLSQQKFEGNSLKQTTPYEPKRKWRTSRSFNTALEEHYQEGERDLLAGEVSSKRNLASMGFLPTKKEKKTLEDLYEQMRHEDNVEESKDSAKRLVDSLAKYDFAVPPSPLSAEKSLVTSDKLSTDLFDRERRRERQRPSPAKLVPEFTPEVGPHPGRDFTQRSPHEDPRSQRSHFATMEEPNEGVDLSSNTPKLSSTVQDKLVRDYEIIKLCYRSQVSDEEKRMLETIRRVGAHTDTTPYEAEVKAFFQKKREAQAKANAKKEMSRMPKSTFEQTMPSFFFPSNEERKISPPWKASFERSVSEILANSEPIQGQATSNGHLATDSNPETERDMD
jgi:hypothetical protein